MITLKSNTSIRVNENQFNLIRARWSWLIAYRKEDNKYFIKALLFQGYKKMIESELNQLN